MGVPIIYSLGRRFGMRSVHAFAAGLQFAPPECEVCCTTNINRDYSGDGSRYGMGSLLQISVPPWLGIWHEAWRLGNGALVDLFCLFATWM